LIVSCFPKQTARANLTRAVITATLFSPRASIALDIAGGATNTCPHFLSEDCSMTQQKAEKKITSEKPIKLDGVDFKDLMRAFLQVKPKKKSKTKRGK
jgi:hypothetical protein